MKRKIKPMDRSTVSRLKKERRCFEADHLKRIESYAVDASRMAARIAFLEEELKTVRANTVDKALLEEHEKTAFHKGLHEGQVGKEEELRNSKVCFSKMHIFVDRKTPHNLNFGEVVSLFAKLSLNPLSGGVYTRITVLVPDGVSVDKMTDVQSIKFAKEFVANNVKVEKKGDT